MPSPQNPDNPDTILIRTRINNALQTATILQVANSTTHLASHYLHYLCTTKLDIPPSSFDELALGYLACVHSSENPPPDDDPFSLAIERIMCDPELDQARGFFCVYLALQMPLLSSVGMRYPSTMGLPPYDFSDSDIFQTYFHWCLHHLIEYKACRKLPQVHPSASGDFPFLDSVLRECTRQLHEQGTEVPTRDSLSNPLTYITDTLPHNPPEEPS
jgi:hypothetical protein